MDLIKKKILMLEIKKKQNNKRQLQNFQRLEPLIAPTIVLCWLLQFNYNVLRF